jgi:hypothetical protein
MMILEPDGLFRMAAADFQQAQIWLNDVEVQLLRMRARLENCAAQVRQIPRDEALWQQVDETFKREPAEAAVGGTAVSG